MRTQRGFALLELLLAAGVTLLLVIWAAQAMSHRVNDASAQHYARWMIMVRNAVGSYLEQHGDLLRQAQAPTDLVTHGYQNWAAPHVSELKADGLLAQGFPERVRPLDGARVQILREGECPGEACRINAIVYSQRAFTKAPGVVDEQMLAQWLLSAQGLGGMVHPSRPALISGHTFQYPNPPSGGPALPPGTVVMALTDGQQQQFPYLRVRDERDPEFQSDATVQGDISAGGIVSVGDYIQLHSTAEWFDACPSTGALTRDSRHGLLVCKDGVWDVVARSGGGFSVNSHYGCATPEGRSSANPVTGTCTCPIGYSLVPISEGGSEGSGRGLTQGYLCVY